LYAQTVGGLDTTFNSVGRVDDVSGKYQSAYAMAIQPDGKIIVGGRNDISASVCHFIMKRYKIDGKLDSIFGTDGVVETTMHGSEDVINSIALQSDGKIVVAGTSWSDITAYDIAIARYNTNGTLDNTFGNNGIKLIDIRGTDDKINSALVIQPDGKIIAAGFTHNDISYDFMLLRLSVNGSLDTSFGTDGFAITDVADSSSDAIRGIVLQPDGKIVAVGSSITSSNVAFIAARYLSTGVLDSSFGVSGLVIGVNTDETTEDSYSVLIQPDGKIISVGTQQRNPGNWRSAQLIRYNTDGTYDTDFGKNGVVVIENIEGYDEIYSSVLQPDGKIVIAGNTRNNHPTLPSRDFLLMRLNIDGSLDSDFGNAGKIITDFGFNKDDFGYAIARQNDGKILAAGYVGNLYSNSGIGIARYNTELNTSIKESFESIGMTIYPNPANDKITVVNQKQTVAGNSIISIYNIHGQLILKQPMQLEKTDIDISKLTSGCYILKMNDNKTLKVTQFMKE